MDRILGLDIVRTIAILQVVIVHSLYVLPADVKDSILSLIPAIDGVSIFFVLSGFLIGGILLRTIENEGLTSNGLVQFWIRRWFRTLPNYFLVLFVLLLYDVVIYRVESHFSPHYLVFAQNLIHDHPDFFPEAWSLSVEEWFYFLFPIVCYAGFKLVSTKRYVLLFGAFFFLLVPFLMRLAIQMNEEGIEVLDLRKIVIYRLDSLMYGVLGAYLFKYNLTLWRKIKYPGLWLSFFLIMALTVYNNLFKDDQVFWKVYSFNIESFATLLALPYFSTLKKIGINAIEKLFRFISLISYSMYILNLSILQWRVVPILMSLFNLNDLDLRCSGVVSHIVFWPLLFLGSYLLYNFYELPMMNLRDNFRIVPSYLKGS